MGIIHMKKNHLRHFTGVKLLENPQSVLKSKIYRVKVIIRVKILVKYINTELLSAVYPGTVLNNITLLSMLCSIFKAVHLFSNATESLCLQNHRHHVQITLTAATYCPNRPLL